MREVFLYKLKFKSPLHVGFREEFLESTEDYIHSDTLFSAFCNSYLLFYGEKKLNELLEKFKTGQPPFLISSSFYWIGNELYFPIPLNQFPAEKEFKKVKFIDMTNFEKIREGKKIEELMKSEDIEKLNKDLSSAIQRNIIPRVRINRLNKKTEYFHFSEITFSQNSGLFFLVEFKESSFQKEFDAVLNLLGDEGLGGDRTVGKGLFKVVEKKKIEFKTFSDEDSFVLLSLTYPKEEEIKYLRDGFYEIISREGYIFSPFGKTLRRKSIRMVKEGAVVRKEIKGEIVEVTPREFKRHPVYRYGLAFSLSFKSGVEK